MLLGAGGVWILGILRRTAEDRLLGSCIMTLFGMAVTGFVFRREYLQDNLDYDNVEHASRFWSCIYIGLAFSFVCGLIPVAGWPFLPVFVMLALFSNMGVGILASSMLLMTAVLISGGNANGFALYLVSGVFAVSLFRHLKSDFKIVGPLFLSLFCLLVCETANVVLIANARPDLEMFLIPAANIVISGILLLGCLKLFFTTVVYRFRDRYLDINDTENSVLAELKQKDKQIYMQGIHTAYFCERIGRRLGVDADALKAAGYYYRMEDKIPQLMEEGFFPDSVKAILEEYLTLKKRFRKKETAVLICSDMVLTSVRFLQEKGDGRQPDYDKMVDALFKKLLEEGSFDCCNITVEELRIMQKIFKEEKLYYDFLH